jgi:hypothetical protein
MFLEFNLPIRINLVTNEKENLSNTFINFNYKKYNCFLKLKSEKDIIENKEEEKITYRRNYHGISIMIEDNSKGTIENFVKEQSMVQILKLINLISNRCLLVFRNYGNLTKVKEFSLQLDSEDIEQFKSFFMMLDIKISKKNNKEHEKILKYWDFKIDIAKEFTSIWLQKSYFNVYDEEYLDYEYWLEIKNALENNLEITEERYFFVNSLEHIHSNNIRLAVIETVIGLEIAVNKYLTDYLKFKNIPSDRIGNLINSKTGIHSMVSVLLDLSIEEEVMETIKIDEVLKLITLRNDIIHHNKQIPKEPSERKEIFNQIASTHILCKLLVGFCNKRINIKALLKNTQRSYDIENIEIRCLPDKPIIVLIVYLKEYSNKLIDKINFSIINSLKDFRGYERLYNEKEHLYISYRFNKKVMAKFSKGKLVFLNQ